MAIKIPGLGKPGLQSPVHQCEKILVSSPCHFQQHPHNCCRWRIEAESALADRSGRTAWSHWSAGTDGRNPPSQDHSYQTKCQSCRQRRFSLFTKCTLFSWESQHLFIPTTPRHQCPARVNDLDTAHDRCSRSPRHRDMPFGHRRGW